MLTKNIKWYEPTELYVLTVNEYIKFGISSNWLRRQREYEIELEGEPFTKVHSINYSYRWQAELIEQILKWRLRKWAVSGRHEWIKHLQVQNVLDCLNQIREVIEEEFDRHYHIHNYGDDRYDWYKQIANGYFYDGE
ncbi:hypothetical protein [Fulvivirga lutea]|uniref:Uncharacterized protein n=1 Tax=Fulvivirga lutea TaxID=2810512 RepID=A0A975A1W3_9BACT|nr:hypothetical protein [Fulvivirga lutea]QSE98650.1 hypothetical protein JR347_06110 [Fulvivirga lutea]